MTCSTSKVARKVMLMPSKENNVRLEWSGGDVPTSPWVCMSVSMFAGHCVSQIVMIRYRLTYLDGVD